MKRITLFCLALFLAICFPCGQKSAQASGVKEGAQVADGIYKIQNKATGRYLNMQMAGMVDRVFVHQFGETGMLDEIWRVEKLEDGYRITNLFVPRHLAVRELPAAAGGAIHVSVEESKENRWQLYEEDGAYRFVPSDGPQELGMALPVNDIASKYLPVLAAYGKDDTSLWVLEPVSLASELPQMLPLTGQVFHASCPQIIKQDGVYYMYIMAPNILIKSSTDMIHWKKVGTVFGQTDPSWLTKEVPGYGIWAPSVYHLGGKYYLYYCISTIGSQNSAIGVAVNTTLDPSDPDYKWVDGGMVIRSHTGSPYNCIDPNIVIDGEGKVWLNFGSYWGGIYQRQIDPATGHLLTPDEEKDTLYHLARRNVNNGAVEAAYMIWHDGYYYLFTAFNPMDLSYHNRVGRSASVHGPFVDKEGREMTSGGGTVVTKGMYELQMPGHASVFLNEDGQYYFVGEYFRKDSPSIMMISTIVWNDDGWPVTALTPDIALRLPGKQ